MPSDILEQTSFFYVFCRIRSARAFSIIGDHITANISQVNANCERIFYDFFINLQVAVTLVISQIIMKRRHVSVDTFDPESYGFGDIDAIYRLDTRLIECCVMCSIS